MRWAQGRGETQREGGQGLCGCLPQMQEHVWKPGVGACLVLSRNSKDSTVAELGARGRWEVMDEVGEMTEDQSGWDLAVNYTDCDCYLE